MSTHALAVAGKKSFVETAVYDWSLLSSLFKAAGVVGGVLLAQEYSPMPTDPNTHWSDLATSGLIWFLAGLTGFVVGSLVWYAIDYFSTPNEEQTATAEAE